MTVVMSLHTIVEGSQNGHKWQAETCLREAARLPIMGPSAVAYIAASQTFALLHVASLLESSGAGYSLADAVCHAGDMQP